ncbi:MAG: glycosyltransferase family 39 protein [Terriglobales bacterium]|jgi:4-amino-4-deoxy-L-arabinose transferase-like glycosyltransferase
MTIHDIQDAQHRLSPNTLPYWTPLHSYLLLSLATLGCLLPFSGKAFHIDDPLFVWTAQQIAHHPFNPYGFRLVWYVTDMPMSAITKNPPLSSYYGALVGIVAGWSERACHLGFLLPALAVVLGTYHLAERFTKSPMIAAAATLFAPGFLASATGVMCDVMMLALWVWAVILWMRGIDSGKALHLAASGVLIAACALTKYFGASLILLLPAYSLLKQRRMAAWVWCLLMPVAGLVGYQFWTKALYGRGLLWDAAQYARSPEHVDQASRLTSGLVGLSFLGGCALPILLFSFFLWNRRQLILGSLGGALAGLAVGMRWLLPLIHDPRQHWVWIAAQFAFYVAGGISVLGLVVADYRKRKDADSALLALWILGTFLFAAFLNWTVNARSLLPLIPAAAILLARRLDEVRIASPRWPTGIWTGILVVPLALSAMISLSIAWGDTALADSGRSVASLIHGETQNQPGSVLFEGHWGFQYYMQLLGARPVEYDKFAFQTGDLVVTPENTTSTFPIAPQFVAAQQILQIDPHAHAATMALGAGFYSSVWGPLPFSFGRVPSENYLVVHLQQPIQNAH